MMNGNNTLSQDDVYPFVHDLEDRAHRAYHRRMSHAFAVDQPRSGADTYLENGTEFVVLSNIRGVLAVYRIRKNGTLQWTEYIPEACRKEWGIDI